MRAWWKWLAKICQLIVRCSTSKASGMCSIYKCESAVHIKIKRKPLVYENYGYSIHNIIKKPC